MLIRRNWRRLLALVASALACLVVSDAAHSRYQTSTSVPAVRVRPAGLVPAQRIGPATELPERVFAAAESKPESTNAAGSSEARAQTRMQKIRQLTFDRRPSSMLKAWSGIEEGEEQKAATAQLDGVTPVVENGADALAAVPAKAFAAPGERSQKGEPVTVPRNTTPIPPNSSGAPKPASEDAAFEKELRRFSKAVTMGDWEFVRVYLKGLAKEEGKALYARLIEALPQAPGMPNVVTEGMPPGVVVPPQEQQFQERNRFSNDDVIGLLAAAPAVREAAQLSGLGQIARQAFDQGNAVEDLVVRLGKECAKPASEAFVSGREVVKLLFAAGAPIEAGKFLPTPEDAEESNDREALNLLSEHYLAHYAKEKKAEFLEKAWTVTQAVLAVGVVNPEQKARALRQAVELAPKIRKELGQEWLVQSFTERPERGMEILASIGSATSRGFQTHPSAPEERAKSLELQRVAVEALLERAPERAKEWSGALAVLAGTWLLEADYSRQYDRSTMMGPMMRRDVYGNFFFLNEEDAANQMMMQQNPNMPRAIPVRRIIENRPSELMVGLLGEAYRPQLATVLAQLYLKVNEEAKAFPSIEILAKTHPERAQELAEEFLRVWIKNHDLNSAQNRTNPYYFMFGFERRAESIPLTRSKQERNLTELSTWLERLKKLPIPPVDEDLVAKAFTTSHSTAEVYRMEAIERVFGSLDRVESKTLASLAQRMRENLAGLWRAPAVQEQAKTKRKERDIKAEVLRGYELAQAVVAKGLERYPDDWGLALSSAALRHDENNYRHEIEPSTAFSKTRTGSFGEFAKAAELYARRVPGFSEDEETILPFEQWFYASLGACDIEGITEKTQPDPREAPKIREAMASLAGEAGERHRTKFANSLFTRLSGVNPAVKFRFLRGGFEIVGDHPQASEARKVFDYYEDLVTELKLDAMIDGPTTVEAGEPFGVFVNLRHTREIERESGGFGRYLQNQNSGNMYYYNYGRPLENYRDKFTDAAKKALEEHFEVLSVTFQDDKVNSRAGREYGWRVTPYAYLLLKTRGPKVDRIPPLRLDLDFLDTSGYVILPVESASVPIVANAGGPIRPFGKLQLTQTLDERQAKDGQLILEVKAVAQGLVPAFDEILSLESPGFDVVRTEDQGLSVSKFDTEAAENVVVSERNWLVTLRALQDLKELPKEFRFGTSLVDGAEVVYQRYDDADLAKTDAVVPLGARYGEVKANWILWLVGLGVLMAVTGAIAWRLRPRSTESAAEGLAIPKEVTPFTVLWFLREIQRNNGMAETSQRELAASIAGLERKYFAGSESEEPGELRGLAERWAARARGTRAHENGH